MRKLLPVTLLLSGVLVVTAVLAQSEPETVAATSEAQALLQVPAADYRRDWVLLGSFSVLADKPEEGAKELHVVYTQPESVEAYRKTGAFPDGAVLVKDVFATRTEALTTGTASYANTLTGRFVMVKDEAGKYSGLLRSGAMAGVGLSMRERKPGRQSRPITGRTALHATSRSATRISPTSRAIRS